MLWTVREEKRMVVVLFPLPRISALKISLTITSNPIWAVAPASILPQVTMPSPAMPQKRTLMSRRTPLAPPAGGEGLAEEIESEGFIDEVFLVNADHVAPRDDTLLKGV